jgi:hypothetical protein
MPEYHPVTGIEMIELTRGSFLDDIQSVLTQVLDNINAFAISGLGGTAFLLSDIQVREGSRKAALPSYVDQISGNPYESVTATVFRDNASVHLEQVLLRRTSYVLTENREEVAFLLFDFLEETGRYNKRGTLFSRLTSQNMSRTRRSTQL